MSKIKIVETKTYVIDTDKIISKPTYNGLRYAPFAESYADKVLVMESLANLLMYNRAAVDGQDTTISAAFME